MIIVEWIEQQAIDGEIAPLHVFFGIAGIADFIGMTAVAVQPIAAKRRNFNAVAGGWWLVTSCRVDRRSAQIVRRNQHHAKLRAHGISFGEYFHHFRWGGVGGHVVIRRLAAQQQIAHTSADQVSLVVALAQSAHDFNRRSVHGKSANIDCSHAAGLHPRH